MAGAAHHKILIVGGGAAGITVAASLKRRGTADIAIIETETPWTVVAGELQSKSKNTPFDGWELYGRAKHTICGGVVVH